MSSQPPAVRSEPADQDLRGLVELLAKSLVDEPEQVSVEAIQEGDTTVLELRVAPGDIGKVIGKQGRTARAFRAILGAAGMKLDHRFELEILE
ncbi:MAG: KH domain-containing protein [Terriglobales bacterium]